MIGVRPADVEVIAAASDDMVDHSLSLAMLQQAGSICRQRPPRRRIARADREYLWQAWIDSWLSACDADRGRQGPQSIEAGFERRILNGQVTFDCSLLIERRPP